MSDPRPTARSIAHDFLVNATLSGCMFEPVCEAWPKGWPHDDGCDRLTDAIEADRAASDAREDRLREALDHVANCRFLNDGEHCAECLVAAREALAAVPPGSDR